MGEARGETAGLGAKSQAAIEFGGFFLFCSSTNTDRQTDKPKSRFQESTEAQDKLL